MTNGEDALAIAARTLWNLWQMKGWLAQDMIDGVAGEHGVEPEALMGALAEIWLTREAA